MSYHSGLVVNLQQEQRQQTYTCSYATGFTQRIRVLKPLNFTKNLQSANVLKYFHVWDYRPRV